MPYHLGIAPDCKYAAVKQIETYLENAYTDKSGNGDTPPENSGSNIVYHEMNDIDSDAGQDISESVDLEGLNRQVGFWPQPRRSRRCARIPSTCGKCTGREILLTCILALLIITLVTFLVISQDLGEPVCSTRECVLVAGQIANSVDEFVDPCEDFYEFTCGGWIKKNPLPSGHSYWDNFAIQKRSIEASLKNILEEEVLNNKEQSSERKAKLIYEKCLDLSAINKYGVEPAKDLIEKLGGWSVNGKKEWSDFNLGNLLGKIAPYGVNTYFAVVAGVDLKNVSSNVLQVAAGSLNLSKRKFYLNKTLDDPILKAYVNYMTEVGVLVGGERTNSRQLMEDIIRLEQRIAEIHMPAEQARHRDLYYKSITIEELQKISPALSWIDRINAVFSEAFPDENFNSSRKIVTCSEEYLTKVTDILQSTPNETLNNYAIWQVVSGVTSALGEDFLQLHAELTKQISGSDPSCIERWRTCVNEVDSSFGSVLGKLFVEHSFSNSSRNMAKLMVKEIKNAFKRNLPKTTWLDKETEQKALEKVDAIRDMVGYPDYILNQTKTNEEFSDVHFSKEMSYFEMQIALLRFFVKENMKGLKKPVDKDEWEMTPPTINAYYTPLKNSIVFPAGILQPPAYSRNYPQSFNFGGMGLVVGHELTHGFDDGGRRYGIAGNLENWWKEETVREFEKKTKCMVEQYSNLKIDGQNVNGNLTLGENIADNGGVRLAYDAYMQWRKTGDLAEDPLLPSLVYSRDQLFFIASAQLWCSVNTPQYMKEFALLSSHSPNKIRVNGFTINSPEFAEAFNCPLGSNMNPAKKCKLW